MKYIKPSCLVKFTVCMELVTSNLRVCQIYWVYAVQRQKRVVAVDGNSRYVSLPADYPLLFQPVARNHETSKSSSDVSLPRKQHATT